MTEVSMEILNSERWISCQERNPPSQGVYCRYAYDIVMLLEKNHRMGDMVID